MNSRPGLLLVILLLCVPLHATESGKRWIIDSPESLAAAQRDSQPGDILVLMPSETPHRGPIALKSGQTLTGEAASPVVTADNGIAISIRNTTEPVTIVGVSIRAEKSASALEIRDAAEVTIAGVDIETSSGAGLVVNHVSKLRVSDSAVETAGGVAIQIANSDLDVSFRKVVAAGPQLERGIALEKTTGRFTVTGGSIEGASLRGVSAIDATNVTVQGMTIAHSASVNGVAAATCGGDLVDGSNEGCNAAVYLRNVDGATLDKLVIDGSGQSGIVAHDVSDLSVIGCEIRKIGNELFEHALSLQNLTGECRITETTVEKSASRHVMLHNAGGRLKLTIDGSRFADTAEPNGQQAVLISAAKNAAIDVEVTKSSFSRTFSNAVDVIATDEAKLTVRVVGNTFDRQAAAVSLAATRAAWIDYRITDNPSITGSTASAINVYLGVPSTGQVSGTIARNVIGRTGVAGSGTNCNCSGITVTAAGDGAVAAEVTGNIVQQVSGPAIVAGAGPGGAQMIVAIHGNLLREPGNASAPAIRASSSTTAKDVTRLCADIGGSGANANTIESGWSARGPIQLLHRFGSARFEVAGLTGDNGQDAAAAAVAGRNRGTQVMAVLRPDSQATGFHAADRCEMPQLIP